MSIIASLILTMRNIHIINKSVKQLENKQVHGDTQTILDKITRYCVSTPIKLFIVQIFMPTIFIPLILLIIGAEAIVITKISLVFILFISLSATMSYVFAQNEFKKIITDLYEKYPDKTNRIIELKPKISLKMKILLEVIPLIIIALLFTSLLAYTTNSKAIGNIYNKFYNKQLMQEFGHKNYINIDDIIHDLKSFNEDIIIDKFIIDVNGNYKTLENTELSEFFIKYTLSNQMKNRTYDYYCIDREGTFIKVNTTDGHTYFVGVLYNTSSEVFIIALTTSFIILLLAIFIVLVYIATSISRDIKTITNGLNRIIDKKDLKQKLITTVNDESGELTESFTEIQRLIQENINEINEKQELIVRQGQMSILGEMAGGMAHDINNPASAINMSIDILYDKDNKEERKEILDNMKQCIERILNIVSGVRDQFRNLGNTKKEIFDFKEVMQNIEIVMKNQLVKYKCNLEIDYNNDFKIYGEKNKLNQVISNIVMNAILAYNEIEKNGIIYIKTDKDTEENVISIKDEAGGIPENVKDQLFSKILTTRGKQGTGLGLYLAKSIIEDEFQGQISFETKIGEGTTFYIKLPKNKEE